MNLFKKIKALFAAKPAATHSKPTHEVVERLARLERSYIVLLKRVLEIDGMQLHSSKINELSSKVLQTPKDALNKGLNEPEPTIH